jgi:hypothetical protein
MPRPRTKSDSWVGLPMLMSSSVPGSGQTRLDRQMGSSGSELERPAGAMTTSWRAPSQRPAPRVVCHQATSGTCPAACSAASRANSIIIFPQPGASLSASTCSGLHSVNATIHHLVSSSFWTAWDRWSTISRAQRDLAPVEGCDGGARPIVGSGPHVRKPRLSAHPDAGMGRDST